jgi:hypothetical protein
MKKILERGTGRVELGEASAAAASTEKSHAEDKEQGGLSGGIF